MHCISFGHATGVGHWGRWLSNMDPGLWDVCLALRWGARIPAGADTAEGQAMPSRHACCVAETSLQLLCTLGKCRASVKLWWNP